jgi:hypothetical protein
MNGSTSRKKQHALLGKMNGLYYTDEVSYYKGHTLFTLMLQITVKKII